MYTKSRNKVQRKKAFYLGFILIALGILCNKWVLEITIVPDKAIEFFPYVLLIYVFQVIILISGLYLIIRKPDFRIPSKKELLLVSTGITLIFVMLEVGTRIWLNFIATPRQRQEYVLYDDLSPEESQWTNHHYLNYYPTPDYKFGLTSHNPLGFRNKEFSIQKPDGVYRIAVLGGSAAYGLKVEDNGKTFTSQLEILLRDEHGYNNIEVINAGVSGYNSWESLINLEFRVLDVTPDLIIVSPEYDDVHSRLVSPIAYRGDNIGRRKQWKPPAIRYFERSSLLRVLSRFFGFAGQTNLQSFVSSSTYMGACSAYDNPDTPEKLMRDLLKKNPPVYFRRNLLNMAAIAKMHDIKIIFTSWAFSTSFKDYATTPHYREGFRENNIIIKEVSNNQNIPFFDFANVMSKEKRYWADGRHINEEGAVLKAELFSDFIHESKLVPR